jgi:hypothetical protein
MLGLGLIVAVVVVIIGGFYYWARRSGPLATGRTAAGTPGERRISLLTEAVAYVGAILLLAGGVTGIGQRWEDMSRSARVGVLAGAAAFFLLVGALVRRVREPAIQRLVGVVWLLSVVGVAWAVTVATLDVHDNTSRFTVLVVGAAVTVYAAALWLVRRRALQNLALFAGLIVAACGTVVALADSAPSLAFALVLWGLGLVWAGLGWRRLVDPTWVTIASGVALALVAPSFGIAEHGWVFAIGIATAAAAMAASVPLRNTPLLASGAVVMFGYVTALVVRYFGESLGVPAALAITGVLIIGLAVVTARLRRAARPATPSQPGTQRPPRRDMSKVS